MAHRRVIFICKAIGLSAVVACSLLEAKENRVFPAGAELSVVSLNELRVEVGREPMPILFRVTGSLSQRDGKVQPLPTASKCVVSASGEIERTHGARAFGDALELSCEESGVVLSVKIDGYLVDSTKKLGIEIQCRNLGANGQCLVGDLKAGTEAFIVLKSTVEFPSGD